MSARATRIVVMVCAVWTVLCVGSIAWQIVRNPMGARAETLEARLADGWTIAEDMPEPNSAPMRQLRTAITGKKSLWTELVAAPPAPPKPQADPKLKEKLTGVTATRDGIARGDKVFVKIFLGPQDKNGSWKSVGDVVNGLTIREIAPEAVVFGLEQGGKEYTVELPRR